MTAQRPDILSLMHQLRSRGDAFAVATVVRTVSVTAAKPGAKAIVDADGEIIEGWIGGGCARHAVVKAAMLAIADGQSRLVSIQPEELMADAQASPSEAAPLHVQARNMCPSKGSMDVFIEPMLSNPELWVVGASPVARALAELAPVFDFDVNVVDAAEVSSRLQTEHLNRYVVIATQGSGDLKALSAALSLAAQYIGFVGSSRKIAHLKTTLEKQGIEEQQLDCIHCPAGMDINAVTPQEIALSIIADLVRRRRA